MLDQVKTFIMMRGATTPQKSKAIQLPTGGPISLDVIITGTATVNLYASNIESDPAGSEWGSPIKSFTTSQKIIIENEPWKSWMIEYASGTGTVSAAFGL